MSKTKRNDNSDKFSDWSTKKLKQYAKSYHALIYDDQGGCYGTKDLIIYDCVCAELDKRGISLNTNFQF